MLMRSQLRIPGARPGVAATRAINRGSVRGSPGRSVGVKGVLAVMVVLWLSLLLNASYVFAGPL